MTGTVTPGGKKETGAAYGANPAGSAEAAELAGAAEGPDVAGGRPRFVLASASSARFKTLRGAGVEPEVIVSGVDEDHVTAESPGELARLLATLKARAVVATLDADAIVLGCDSVLELDGVAYGKPGTPEVARERLRMLRGRSGVLHTGHCLIDTAGRTEQRELASTTVHFDDFTDADLEAYVATGEPLAVAGSFTVDGLGGTFVAGIEGDHHNVVGLSLPLLRRMLAKTGVAWPSLWQPPHFAYDETEAARYDETRGGTHRAHAAAEAVDHLLSTPGTSATGAGSAGARSGPVAEAGTVAADQGFRRTGRVVELAVGTGIVAAELVALGHLVHGIDLSPAMLRHAAVRLPGHVAVADAGRLPFGDRRCDAVVAIWLLHLLDDTEAVIAEAARVLRPGGVLITTTEKSDASRYAAGRSPKEHRSGDALSHLVARAAAHGLTLDGATTFEAPHRTGPAAPVYPIVRFRRTRP